jgi:ABC-type multidrug transport system ATPase subunit
MTATIRTQQLTKQYGSATVLDALDLEIEAGEVFGYLGPNGAGKSTTIAILLGLIRPTSGSERIFDLDVWDDAATVHRRLAHVPSEANLWPSLTERKCWSSSRRSTAPSTLLTARNSSIVSSSRSTRRCARTATAIGRR